ncbi:hypothetical protein Glove_135g76 [Diversispora epigaea]|uniref:Uncharacterized protein n=1 Tax=Diversispora epigaea TaxID=1348612 RepID=A0A397J380_9GLOM|nr:hypothetical protein Glove_135g76 [Diversispora epigaea]
MFALQFLGSKYIKVYPYTIGNKDKDKAPKNENYGERYILCDDLVVVAQHQDEVLWKTVQYFFEFIARDKNCPWYENVRFKLIGPEKIPDISKFKNTGRKTVIVFDDLAGEPLSTQLKIIPFFRSDMYDNYEPIAKKVYEVIKKHYVIIDSRKPSDDPLSIRYRWDKPLLKTVT